MKQYYVPTLPLCALFLLITYTCVPVTKQYNLVPVKGRLPYDWECRQSYGPCVGGM